MAKQKHLKNSFYTLYTDGASRGNPGRAGAGIVILAPDGDVILQKGIYLGEKTNNEAEYLALLLGLKEACKLGIKDLYIYIDSQLVVNHLKGIYKLRAKHLKPLYEKTKQALSRFSYQISHISRDKNKLADKLANLAIDRELE